VPRRRQRTNQYGIELEAALARDPHLSSAIAANPAAYAQDLTFVSLHILSQILPY
jgi:hypothetical protein